MHERGTDRQTDRQTDSMTLAEPTPDMTKEMLFKCPYGETGPKRFVLLSRAFDPNTPIFNGENPNASHLRWPAWIIKFQNPQFFFAKAFVTQKAIKMNNNKDQ